MKGAIRDGTSEEITRGTHLTALYPALLIHYHGSMIDRLEIIEVKADDNHRRRFCRQGAHDATSIDDVAAKRRGITDDNRKDDN